RREVYAGQVCPEGRVGLRGGRVHEPDVDAAVVAARLARLPGAVDGESGDRAVLLGVEGVPPRAGPAPVALGVGGEPVGPATAAVEEADRRRPERLVDRLLVRPGLLRRGKHDPAGA